MNAPAMKQIVMLQGMGNNERGWARLVSKFGRVVMIQQGMIQHVEIWEQEELVYDGPEENLMASRKWDERLFSLLTVMRSLRSVRRFSSAGKIDVVIAPNYNMGLAALLLKRSGKARKVIVWLSDHLPPRGSLAVRVHRRITGALNRYVCRRADEVWTVSPRIPAAAVNPRNFVVPICINDNQTPSGPRNEIGYIGIPTADHALELLFEVGRKHGFRINIIGHSNYLESIRHLAPEGTVFHGLLNDQNRINAVLSRCFCGYAVYRNTGPDSYSYFGIPSKAFAFLSSNTPVVTTNTAHFTRTLADAGVGHVVEPSPSEVEFAILDIQRKFSQFTESIVRFRERWNRNAEQFHRERLSAVLGESEPLFRGDLAV